MRKALTSPTAKKIYIAFGVILVAFLWWNMVDRAMRGSGQYDDFTEFSRDLLFRRINVYESYTFDVTTITKYPPFFGVLFAPLVLLPVWLGAAIWFGVNLVLAAGACYLGALILWAGREGRPPLALSLAPFLLTVGVIGSNLETAQVNIFIVFFTYLALYLFTREDDRGTGLLLGFVTALKLTPGLFVAYFAWKRAWGVVLWSAAGLVLCWVGVLALAMGPGYYADVMSDWLVTLVPFLSEGTIAEGVGGFRHTNQSLSAVFHRFFTRTPADGGRGEDFYLNVASIDRDTASLIMKVAYGLILAFLGWFSWGRVKDRTAFRLAVEYSLVMVAALLISPISWINHYVVLIFPFTVATYLILDRPEDSPERKRLWWIVAASFVLLSSSASRMAQALSLPFLGAMLLTGALVVALSRRRQRREGEAEG